MLKELIVSLILFFTLKKQEILSTPINVLKPFQYFNGSDVLAYQGFEKQDNQNVAQHRKKRFLDDILELLNLFDDYFYSDEDDSSSEEESSEDKSNKTKSTNKKHDLCRNCSITYNKINQVQHVQDAAQPLSTQQSKTTIKNQELVTTTDKSKFKATSKMVSLDAKSDTKESNAGQKMPKTSTESLKKHVFTTSTQATVTKQAFTMTEALSSTKATAAKTTKASTRESTTTQAITTTMTSEEE